MAAALHDLDPAFRRFSRSDKVAVLLRSLGFRRPLPVQSMYIFKVTQLIIDCFCRLTQQQFAEMCRCQHHMPCSMSHTQCSESPHSIRAWDTRHPTLCDNPKYFSKSESKVSMPSHLAAANRGCLCLVLPQQPKIGGEVRPHQDSTFLATVPPSVVGLWWALEDSTKQNGCLWALPGSQAAGVARRFLRMSDFFLHL